MQTLKNFAVGESIFRETNLPLVLEKWLLAFYTESRTTSKSSVALTVSAE